MLCKWIRRLSGALWFSDSGRRLPFFLARASTGARGIGYCLVRGTGSQPDTEPLEKFQFVFQGRWEASGVRAFSKVATARKVCKTLSGGTGGGERIEVRDALQLDLELEEGVTVPPAWLTTAAAAQGSYDGLEVEILVHCVANGSVAHFLSLSIQKEGIFRIEEMSDVPEPIGMAIGSEYLAHEGFLPPSFRANIAAEQYPTNAGCGLRRGPRGQ
jgi:hypothetical protein